MKSLKIVSPIKKRSTNYLRVGGFKHVAVPLIAASVACNETICLENVPRIADTLTMVELLRRLGARIQHDDRALTLQTSSMRAPNDGVVLDAALSRAVHGSLYLLPVLLGRFGQVRYYGSGGCAIGDDNSPAKRPLAHVFQVMRTLGAVVRESSGDGFYDLTTEGLHGGTIDITQFSTQPSCLAGPYCSGATKTAILLAPFVGPAGVRIVRPYRKPDVMELLQFLVKLGCRVQDNEDVLEVSCTDTLRATSYAVMSDAIEVMTYIALAIHLDIALTLAPLTCDKLMKGLASEIEVMQAMGIKLHWLDEALHIPRQGPLREVDIHVSAESIYSDSQPFFALMMLRAGGSITDDVWVTRFAYANTLRQLGLQFHVTGNRLHVRPSTANAEVVTLEATDLRSAAALLIAAVGAGRAGIRVTNTTHLERGYENFPNALRALGAHLEETDDAASLPPTHLDHRLARQRQIYARSEAGATASSAAISAGRPILG